MTGKSKDAYLTQDFCSIGTNVYNTSDTKGRCSLNSAVDSADVDNTSASEEAKLRRVSRARNGVKIGSRSGENQGDA